MKMNPNFYYYFVSATGEFLNTKTDKWTRGNIASGNYLQIIVKENDITKKFMAHRVVASLYCTNSCPELFTVVHHINSKRNQNNYENLMWVNQKLNSAMRKSSLVRKFKHYFKIDFTFYGKKIRGPLMYDNKEEATADAIILRQDLFNKKIIELEYFYKNDKVNLLKKEKSLL